MSDLLANLRSAGSEEEREWLVMKFSLESLEAAVLEAVWAAAIPQWFDKEFLGELLEKNADEDFLRDFEKLTSLSFVETFQSRGYNIHERSRKLLLKHLWKENLILYRELNKRAAEYSARQDATDPLWRVLTLYHRLLADDPTGLDQFIAQEIEWKNHFQYNNLEALARLVTIEFEAQRLNARAGAWAYFFQAECDTIYSNYDSAKRNLELSLATYSQDLRLRAEILASLGNTYYMLDEYSEAKQKLEEALILYKQADLPGGVAACTRVIGEIHRILGEYHEAQQNSEEALKLFRQAGDPLGESACIWSIGAVHYDQSQYSEARQKFHEARQLFQALNSKLGEANCMRLLGDISRSLGEYGSARQEYEQAREMYLQVNNKMGEAYSIAGLGRLHVALGENDAGIARLEEALEVFRRIGDKLGERNCQEVLDKIKTMPNDP